MDYIEILKSIGQAILFVIWVWSMSRYFSTIVIYKKKSLCIKISEMETTDPYECKRFYPIYHSDLYTLKGKYSSYQSLEPFIKKIPNLGLYINKGIKTLEDRNIISLKDEDIENYKISKGSVDRFNL